MKSEVFGKQALIGGSQAEFVEALRHANGNAGIVVCDIAGKRRYVSEAEWVAGLEAFSMRNGGSQTVASSSGSAAKVSLFRSLFRGRDDVYANGYAKKDGGIGYSPVCENFWKQGICQKRLGKGAKCAKCAGRLWSPLSDRALIEHFQAKSENFKDVVGLYVMNPDCTTWLLVADFDERSWQREVLAYAHAAADMGLEVSIERSRSGNGAHAWMFFSEPIPASLARNIGSLILTRAMSEGEVSSFRAYDRFFPAQDTITEDGLGNLIALPLQGRAFLHGNSVFVGEDFAPYPDQWRYLSSITKVNRETLEQVLESTSTEPLGELAYEGKPSATARWKTALKRDGSRQNGGFSALSLPKVGDENPASPQVNPVVIVESGMLTMEKESVSAHLLNRIRRLAAYGNPQFYRMQSMGKSVRGYSRIVDMGIVTETAISIPRGCKTRLRALLKDEGVPCYFDDRRVCENKIRVEFTGKLKEAQQKAADALLSKECGILQAPTGFGKTIIGAYLIGALKLRTLVIVPNTALLSQWQEKLSVFLDINEELPELLTKTGRKSRKKRSLVGRIGGGAGVPSGIIDIATAASLLEAGEIDGTQHLKDIAQGYGLVICDECHHVAASQYAQILREAPAFRVYGLSATPKRSDGQEKASYLLCGPILYRVNPKEQASDQGFSRYLQPRFTHIRLPKIEAGSAFNQVLDKLESHAARNRMIVEDAIKALGEGHRVLVITKRKEHAMLLAGDLLSSGKTVFLLTGEGSAREKRQRLEELAGVPDNEAFAVVATGSYLGEGFDDPRLDVLLLAAPSSFEGVVTQYSGRLHREHAGKESVIVYDYVDTSVPMLDRMHKRRLKTFAKLGYEVMQSENGETASEAIVDHKSFAAAFAHDVKTAEKSIVLAVPYINERCVEMVEPQIGAAVARGVGVVVRMARASDAERIERTDRALYRLRELGCRIEETERRQSAVALFDSELFWYGSIPLLAFPQKDDCSLRYKNAEICHELMRDENLADSAGCVNAPVPLTHSMHPSS